MITFYDAAHKRLVSLREQQEQFWDHHWKACDLEKVYASVSPHNFVNRVTAQYLSPEQGPILEAGCGMGQFVHALTVKGYHCIGIDTAEETIQNIKAHRPALDVRVMSVENLEFEDGTFAGCWSLGVLEHFQHGFDRAISEMARVLRRGGYGFIMMPVLSLLRRIKIRAGKYPSWEPTNPEKTASYMFHQYVFTCSDIIRTVEQAGFRHINTKHLFGLKGFRDEIPVFQKPLQRLEKLREKGLLGKVLISACDRLLAFPAGHCALWVFQKEDRSTS